MGEDSLMEYKNAKYVSETIIDCEINHKKYGWIPYTISTEDSDNSAKALNATLKAAMKANDDVEAWVAPTALEIAAAQAIEIRMQRDFILNDQVDPIVSNPLRWASFSETKQTEWTVYRQALLDIPNQNSFPSDVTWPTPPE